METKLYYVIKLRLTAILTHVPSLDRHYNTTEQTKYLFTNNKLDFYLKYGGVIIEHPERQPNI